MLRNRWFVVAALVTMCAASVSWAVSDPIGNSDRAGSDASALEEAGENQETEHRIQQAEVKTLRLPDFDFTSPVSIELAAGTGPVEDAYVSTQYPKVNNGGNVALRAGLDRNGYEHASYFWFDVNQVPKYSKIISAWLEVYCYKQEGGYAKTYCGLVKEAWGEYSVTYMSRPEVDQAGAASKLVERPGWVGFYVTDIVQGWVGDHHPNFGVCLYHMEDMTHDLYFFSRENEMPELRPRLRISYAIPHNLPRKAMSSIEEPGEGEPGDDFGRRPQDDRAGGRKDNSFGAAPQDDLAHPGRKVSVYPVDPNHEMEGENGIEMGYDPNDIVRSPRGIALNEPVEDHGNGSDRAGGRKDNSLGAAPQDDLAHPGRKVSIYPVDPNHEMEGENGIEMGYDPNDIVRSPRGIALNEPVEDPGADAPFRRGGQARPDRDAIGIQDKGDVRIPIDPPPEPQDEAIQGNSWGFKAAIGDPNPFLHMTSVCYALPRSGRVSLSVYARDGRVVRSLVEGIQDEGSYRISWDGRDDNGQEVQAGTYFCRLAVDGNSVARKLVKAQ